MFPVVPARAIRVAILADVRLYREGLGRILAAQPGIDVVGIAATAPDGVREVAEWRPDIVLLDGAVTGDGATIATLAAAAPGVRVIGLGLAPEDHEILRCIESGAAGYVSRDATVDELVATILNVSRDEFPCSPKVGALMARRVAALAAERRSTGAAALLTAREREVMRLIDAGLSNKDIASRLGIEVCTVKNHVHHLLEKLQVSRRGEAAARVRAHAPAGSGPA